MYITRVILRKIVRFGYARLSAIILLPELYQWCWLWLLLPRSVRNYIFRAWLYYPKACENASKTKVRMHVWKFQWSIYIASESH